MGVNAKGLYDRFGKDYKQKAIERQTQLLIEYAPKILKEAIDTRGFKHDTWNLADSYVWVVYYKESVKGSGFLWNSKKAKKDSKFHGMNVDGRAIANEFIASYRPQDTNGWELVLAATAPYATYLEGEGFTVITQIFDNLIDDFKGKAMINITMNL